MDIRTRRRVAWVLAVLLACPAIAAAARKGRLIGKVVDPEGAPIPGVKVTTTCTELPGFRELASTNDKGIFKVDFHEIEVEYLYEFEKAGYLTLKVNQHWTLEGTERHEFTMQPGEPARLDDLGPPPSSSTPAISAFNEGVRAFKAGNHETALARFQAASEFDPYLSQVWVALSAIHLEQGRYQEAAEAADKAIALGASDERVLKSRWEAYRQLGDEARTAEAREALEKFGRLSEEAKRIHNEGVALKRAGDEAGAFAKFQEALELDPGLEPALLGVATSGLELDRATEAAAAAETLLAADPDHAEALKIRYNAALQLKDEAKIVDALLGLAAVDSGTARDSLFRLADMAFQRDDAARAKERLGLVLQLDPSHARAHYLLGMILMREGAKQSAVSHLERFLELAPDDADAATARELLGFLKQS